MLNVGSSGFISKLKFGRVGIIRLGTIVSVAKIKALSSTGPCFPDILIFRTQRPALSVSTKPD